jgi:hypothetical protein
MTQHSMKRGLKEFGDAGVEAVLKELQQLHDRKVLEPKNANHLTNDERRAALQYLMSSRRSATGLSKGVDVPMDGNKGCTHLKRRQAPPQLRLKRSCYRASLTRMERA